MRGQHELNQDMVDLVEEIGRILEGYGTDEVIIVCSSFLADAIRQAGTKESSSTQIFDYVSNVLRRRLVNE